MPATKKKRPAATPRDAARQARNEVYGRHILEAAEQVFAEHGFEAAKLQDISKLAGLSMGTIYGVFPGKNEILDALLDDRGRDILERAREAVTAADGPSEALDALIETYIRYFVGHPHFLRMHLRQGTSWVISPASASNGRAAIWREIHALQTEVFTRGVDKGVFVREDPAFLARAFSALDQVLLSDWESRGMKETPEALIERLQNLVVRAFRP